MLRPFKIKLPKAIQMLLVGIVAFNIAWWILAIIAQNKAFPNPISVYALMPQNIFGDMGYHILASLRRIVIGTSIALIIGVLGGLFAASNKKINKIIEPFLYLSYPVPKLALLPIIMIVFGIGETTKIVMIVLIIVFQLMILVRDAINRIPKENYFMLLSLGASKYQNLRHVILPGILPEILSAMRVTTGIAISVLFVTETFGTDKGIGFFVIEAWMRLDYLTMYCGITAISIVGFLLFLTIDIADAVFCRWNKIQSGN